MENNEETRQKPEAPYQSNPGSKTAAAATSTWVRGRRMSYTTRGLPKRGRCEVGELEQGNGGICLLAVDVGAHVSEPASRPAIPLAAP
jgi:hypothetical protein